MNLKKGMKLNIHPLFCFLIWNLLLIFFQNLVYVFPIAYI
jgi:hypothetical protein